MASKEGPAAGSVSASASSSTSSPGSAQGSVGINGASAGGSRWKGRILKRFKLLDQLGQGSMGKVFRAEDVTLRRLVALKVLPTKTRTGQRDHKIDQFIREARSAASIEHPNAVTVYEIGEAAGVHYIAMELVEGGNLEKLVRASGPMEIQRACQVIAEAAEALAAAHSQNIIHRDVKPSNLLLSRNGRCKLADFGLARYEDPQDLNSVRGECVGTPCYIAPELPLGQKATAQSDIYSLGCTLWYLLAGRPPFEARTRLDMLKMHVYAALPDLRELRPDAPERLVEAIRRACAKNPGDRFDSADQFAKVLRTFTIPTSNAAQLQSISSSGSIPAWSPEASPTSASSTRLGPNISPSASGFGPAPLMSAPGIPGAPLPAENGTRLGSPIVWAGIGTVVAVVLIGIGVWIARGGAPETPAKSSTISPTNPPVIKEGPNALLNGNLEQSDDADDVAGWFVPEKYKPGVSFVVENGNRFLRLTNSNPDATLYIDQKVKVDPSWVAVTVSVRMRASNLKLGKQSPHDVRLAMAFRDDNDVRVGGWPPVPRLREDSPWVEKKETFDVPPGAKHLYLQLAMFYATGVADFDDVKVIPRIASGN